MWGRSWRRRLYTLGQAKAASLTQVQGQPGQHTQGTCLSIIYIYAPYTSLEINVNFIVLVYIKI